MDIYPFKTLYIADLNAIQTIKNIGIEHHIVIDTIQHAFPNLNIWLDAGINTKAKAQMWDKKNVKLILGSESFSSAEQYTSLTQQLQKPYTLSLDFLPQGYAGPHLLLEKQTTWPKEIIIMTLTKVGSNAGADVETIKKIMAQTSQHHFYVAGGVRNLSDLKQLQSLSVTGALVASALHNKQISTKELQALAV